MKIAGIIALVLLVVFAATACSPRPPQQEVAEAITSLLAKKRVGLFADLLGVPSEGDGQLANKVDSYEIVNTYTQKINGETWVVYDIAAQVRGVEGLPYKANAKYGFVKRGSRWYVLEF